ncbi:nuclear transport factor 2 family protein [Sphingobium tyrosinilyticum]|uniref:Nuclear transport factor 2 family protein n=1 Tax=Sphingobium tyrosinilyticum TaxID=2715436 RepID=A0ABV9F376_9SPHN
MDALTTLLEIEALKRPKAEYFFYLDTKQWDLWLGLFTRDIILQWDRAVSTRGEDGQTMGPLVGIDAIAQAMPVSMNDLQTVHHGHTPIIDLTSESDATGVWAMEEIIGAPHRDYILHGFGHYRETYRKEEGRWRISKLHLTRLRIGRKSL